jgi:hypothetical protein
MDRTVNPYTSVDVYANVAWRSGHVGTIGLRPIVWAALTGDLSDRCLVHLATLFVLVEAWHHTAWKH